MARPFNASVRSLMPQPSPVSDIAALVDPIDGVSLWWCDLHRRAREASRLAASLSMAEHQRAARFGTEALRNRWIAGRATLRDILAALLDTTPEQVPLRRGRRGRPEIAIDGAPDFNVSHTGDAAIFAVGTRLAPDIRVGADVERLDREVGVDRLARKFLTARERAALDEVDVTARRARFIRTWTYKEAMSKATGDGLVAPFRDLDVDVDTPRVLAGPAIYDASRWRLAAAEIPVGYVAAIALWRIEA